MTSYFTTNEMFSVVTNSNFIIDYADTNSLNIFQNISTANVTAFASTNNTPVSLTLGATSDVNIESLSNVNIITTDIGSLHFWHSALSNNIRHDEEYLKIDVIDGVTTFLGGEGHPLTLRGGDMERTTTVGDLTLRAVKDHEMISTGLSNIFFMDAVLFNSNAQFLGKTYMNDLYVTNNLVSLGNFFGTKVNFLKNEPSHSNVSQVGYAFHINDNDQLELIKYARFSSNDRSVIKRVAIFGNNPINEFDKSDVNNYLVFDEYNGLIMAETSDPAASHILNKYMWRFNADANIYTDVKIGINTDQPTADVHVNGTIKSNFLESDIVLTESLQTKSDQRLKTILDFLDPKECLNKINALKTIKYTFLDDLDQDVKTGFIAQQVKNVIDEAVKVRHTSQLPDCHFIDTTAIIAYLVDAVKELTRQINLLSLTRPGL